MTLSTAVRNELMGLSTRFGYCPFPAVQDYPPSGCARFPSEEIAMYAAYEAARWTQKNRPWMCGTRHAALRLEQICEHWRKVDSTVAFDVCRAGSNAADAAGALLHTLPYLQYSEHRELRWYAQLVQHMFKVEGRLYQERKKTKEKLWHHSYTNGDVWDLGKCLFPRAQTSDEAGVRCVQSLVDILTFGVFLR